MGLDEWGGVGWGVHFLKGILFYGYQILKKGQKTKDKRQGTRNNHIFNKKQGTTNKRNETSDTPVKVRHRSNKGFTWQ